ncbi:hypothetical protein [Rhodococcus sp. LW-XY12]|uniref:hypothetical protein n=1 Tax=Rhodococcus sp. LW-XY12 TaxID=2856851 RepID=UPI001C55CAD5|nr:hypothetical protein [Rhodococcus sp. LW-XY12]QXU53632.1 hypothetical protein KXC42_23390 [Rhodococcus sp. LW-XY12]
MSKYWMDTYCAATLEAAPGHKCLCTHHRPLHPSPHRCACGHLWGDPFVEMTYDEQRAFLGLKDVRSELAWQRIGRQFKGIAAAFQKLGEDIRVSLKLAGVDPDDPDSWALAGEK